MMRRRRAAVRLVAALFMGAAIKPHRDFVKKLVGFHGARPGSPSVRPVQPGLQTVRHSHSAICAITSPPSRRAADQTSADEKLATWNCQYGISNIPAASGTEARSGPKNRPMKMLGEPHFFTKTSPRGRISGYRDSGHSCATCSLYLKPNQYETQSPSAAPIPPAIQTGQKLIPLAPINATMATSAPQAGISSEMKASDSPKASNRTIGAAHA